MAALTDRYGNLIAGPVHDSTATSWWRVECDGYIENGDQVKGPRKGGFIKNFRRFNCHQSSPIPTVTVTPTQELLSKAFAKRQLTYIAEVNRIPDYKHIMEIHHLVVI